MACSMNSHVDCLPWPESIRLGFHGGDTLPGRFPGRTYHRSPGSAATAGSECVVSGRSRRTGGGRTPRKNARPNRRSPLPARTRYRGRSHDRVCAGLAVLLPPSRKSYNSALSSPPIPSPACFMNWAILCGSISRSPPVRVPNRKSSVRISGQSYATVSNRAVICPSSASTARNASLSAISKIRAVVGNLPCVASMITRTSAPIPLGHDSLMGLAVMLWKNRGALVVGVSRMTPAFAAHAIAWLVHREGSRYSGSCRCSFWLIPAVAILPPSCLKNRTPVPTGELLCPWL